MRRFAVLAVLLVACGCDEGTDSDSLSSDPGSDDFENSEPEDCMVGVQFTYAAATGCVEFINVDIAGGDGIARSLFLDTADQEEAAPAAPGQVSVTWTVQFGNDVSTDATYSECVNGEDNSHLYTITCN